MVGGGRICTFSAWSGFMALSRIKRIVSLTASMRDTVTGSRRASRGSWAVRSSWLREERTVAMVRVGVERDR